MLFNSIAFIIFLPLVFLLHWFIVKKTKASQNILLLIASYFFYASWDWRFLFLLLFSTGLDYFSGIQIHDATNISKKKFWLCLSIIANLGFLGIFKYFNFFVHSFHQLLSNFGLETNTWSLNIILPIGISFYTFHGLSYVLDVYYSKIKPEKSAVDYALFVSFFPLLVAGPIERATHLLPQLKQKRIFNYEKAVTGLRQMLWGFFKKIVIADLCANYVNLIFDSSVQHTGSTYFIGAFLFAFQIYCDFSGYSDIAIGTAKLFGIDLLRNFSYPYFSRNIAEFWRRWHISLSSWFRDYLYIPLGGSRNGPTKTIRNIFIIFIVCGFWHGANWTFIAWGFLNALYILPSVILKTNRNYLNIVATESRRVTLKEISSIIITFLLTVLAWIFFRAENIHQALAIYSKIFSSSLFSFPLYLPKTILILIIFLIYVEWIGRKQDFAIEKLFLTQSKYLRISFYYSLIFLILFFLQSEPKEFIYFQF